MTATAVPRTATDPARAVFQTLRAWGVDRVFICPGSTEAALLDASLDTPEVELVTTTHEAITMSMADGHARATGRPAVAYVHTHLGLANALAHLSCAALERSPVVILCGLKATSLHGAVAGFTTTDDVRALPRQWVKWAHESTAPEAVATDLDHALRLAATAPCGPVFLGVAQDRMEAGDAVPVPEAPTDAPPFGRVRPDTAAVDAAGAVLAAADAPLVVAGAETFRSPGAVAAVSALAAALGAPVFSEDRRTIERADTARMEGFAGVLDAAAVAGADAVLLAGARTPIRFEHTAPPMLPADVVAVHLSEDPRELAIAPPHALRLHGDAELGATDLLAALDAPARERALPAPREPRVGDPDAVPVQVPALMRRLCDALEPGTWLIDDSVTSKAALLEHALAPERGLRYLTTAGGSLGWGMGAALGVAEARPGERVVAVVGDGVFQFGVPALWTAVHRGLPVTWVVVDNRSYGAVKAALRRFDGEAAARSRFPAAEIGGPDLAAVARGFGAAGLRLEGLGGLEEALAQPGPAVIDVVTDPNDSGPLR